MYDPKSVILQLAKRWEASYHEVLGTEELKRHLLRMLDEAQRKELASVFSGWSGEQLLAAVDCLDDLDDGHGVIAPVPEKPINTIIPDSPIQREIDKAINDLCKKETERLLADPEYLPMSDPDGIITTDTGISSEIAIEMKEEQKRKGGRPPGAKNRAPRSDKGKPRS